MAGCFPAKKRTRPWGIIHAELVVLGRYLTNLALLVEDGRIVRLSLWEKMQ